MKLPPLLAHLVDRARRRPLIAAGLGLALVILLILLGSVGGESKPATAYFEVRRGDFTVSIVEGGTLQAVQEIAIRNEVEGTSRIIYIVPEGSFVKKGDLLVELDSMQAQDAVSQQQINFEKAQFALIQAEQQLGIQKSVVESEVRAAELKLQFAKMDLDKYLEGEARVNLLTASNNLTKTEAQLSIDRDTLRWSEQLYDSGYETKNVVDRDRLSVTNQELTLQIQEMQLWMLQNFDYERKKTELESNVAETKKDLERVKQQGERKIAQFTADMLTQSNTLALNSSKLERDRKNLEATKIRAPQDGLVVYPISEGRFSSESMIEEGATVRNRQELIKLPDMSRMKVTIKVHESHVNMVQAGQPAFVVLDSMPDRRFAARVDKVSLLPDTQSRWGNPNLKVYNTEVVITDPLPDVKPGVSARAEIVITNIANALSVPIQAVTTLQGKQVVYARRGGRDVATPVEVGMFNTRFIELTSGVEAGDRVLLSPPFDTREKDLEGGILAEGEAASVTNAPVPPTLPGAMRPPEGGTERGPVDSIAIPGMETRGPGPGSGEASPRGQGMPEDLRRQFEEARKQFDVNGDGELDETERQAMREEMQRRFGVSGRGQRGGEGGGGRGNREEGRPRQPQE